MSKSTNRSVISILFPLLFLFLIMSSCVSIKPSAVELSSEVGVRLVEMEKIHQLALQRYFDMEKQKVEDFLTNTWEPLFLKNFLGTSQVLQLLQAVSRIDDQSRSIITETISSYLDDPAEARMAADTLIQALNTSRRGEDRLVRTVLNRYVEDEKLEAAVIHVSSVLGTDEPARIIFEFTEAAHHEMQKRRKELLTPIEQARAQAVAELSSAYAELIRAQSRVTSRLEAASRLSKQQDLMMNHIGIKQISENVQTRLLNVSSAVDNAVGKANDILSATEEGQGENQLGDALQSLREELNTIPTTTIPIVPENNN